MGFWKELKRRNVYKVGVAYLIVAWLIVQAAAIVFPHLDLPEWTVPFVIVILIIGFPLILLFAWAFEITPNGLKWTKEVPHHESITHLTGRKLDYILGGLLVIAVGYILIDKLYIAQHAGKADQMSDSGEAVKAKKSIAVLPFVNMSSDKEQESFVDGLSEELINTIIQLPDLRVIARTSCFVFKNPRSGLDQTTSEMGHLFYVSLGKGPGGVYDDMDDQDPFENLKDAPGYWTGTEYNTTDAWYFYFAYGRQGTYSKEETFNALAVHAGTVSSVQLPPAILLLGSGLMGLGLFRRKFKK